MRKSLAVLLVLVLSISLVACNTQQQTTTPPAATKKANDYSTVYSGELTTMNYLVSSSSSDQAVAMNTVDGLVEYDYYGVIKPSLAKSWKSNDDKTVWTFTLREGVKWLTWESKEYAEVTAQDFVDSAKYILDKKNASKTANVFYNNVKGAKDYFDGKTTDFSTVGIKAKDKYTVEYTLPQPIPYFLTVVTYTSFFPANGKFLAEVGDKFGTDHKTMLNCGAYILKNHEPQVQREFVKNEQYWDKGNVHIPRLYYKYNKEASTLGPELFLRGEISVSSVPIATAEQWLKDPTKKDNLRPGTTSFYTYFYAFNFEPKFAKEYEPDNWMVAVNNVSFRRSIFYALDRRAAMLTAESYDPDRRISNTVTPKNFVAYNGKDYTQIGDLAKFANTDSFQKDKAIQFRDAAKKELAGKATFPVKVMMPYNTGGSDWTNRVQVVEQQLEGVLGKDYVDIIPVGYPPTGFLDATRRAGNYAFQECNTEATYADPQSYTDPFMPEATSKYNRPHFAQGYTEANGKTKWENLIADAKAEVKDIGKRYELFAKAEAFMIDQAFLIPYGIGGGGWMASKIDPFTVPYAPIGLSSYKFKYQKVDDKPMNTEQFKAAEKKWETERTAALKAAGQ